MSSSTFDDEELSAILDGDADHETVAAVTKNPDAMARLEQLRAVAVLVAGPGTEATPRRKAASIAAALQVAETSKQATSTRSLLVQREEKRTRQVRTPWLAAAAAVVLVLIALPLLSRLGQNDADTATTADAGPAIDDATTTSAARSLGVADVDEDAADDESATSAASAGRDVETSEAPAAAFDSSDGDDSAAATGAPDEDRVGVLADRTLTLVELTALILEGELEPIYVIDDPALVKAVSEACLDTFSETEGVSFALAQLPSKAGTPQFVLLHFSENGSIEALDASDCAPIG